MMCTVNLEIPDATNSAIKLFSARNNISVQQFIMNAINEKMSALEQNGYLEERAKKGKEFDIMKFLGKVPDVPADERDKK